MEFAEFLMEIGAWIISFALTFGLFAGLLWCLAKLCEIGDRR